MPRLVALVAVAVAATTLAAGCGGSDDSDGSSSGSGTEEWASGFCSAAMNWSQAIRSSVDSLKGGNVTEDSLRAAADDVTGATRTFVDDLKGLGRPDTEAGQEAKQEVDQLANKLDEELDKIETTIEGASGVTGAMTAVTTISTTLATMGTQFSSTLNELQQLDAQGELKGAFEEAGSCKELSNSDNG